MSSEGYLKICDFGLSVMALRSDGARSPRVARSKDKYQTSWWRSLEIATRQPKYGAEIDVWSAGVILLDIFLIRWGKTKTTAPFFSRVSGEDTDDTDASLVSAILDLVGNPGVYPSFTPLPSKANLMFQTSPPTEQRILDDLFDEEELPVEAGELLRRLLTIDPEARITALDALKSAFIGKANTSFPPLSDAAMADFKRVEECIEIDSEHEKAKCLAYLCSGLSGPHKRKLD
jgi:serine/threonine protein kinase